MTVAVTAYSSRKLIDGLFSAMKTGFHESYIQDPSQNPPSPKVSDASEKKFSMSASKCSKSIKGLEKIDGWLRNVSQIFKSNLTS